MIIKDRKKFIENFLQRYCENKKLDAKFWYSKFINNTLYIRIRPSHSISDFSFSSDIDFNKESISFILRRIISDIKKNYEAFTKKN